MESVFAKTPEQLVSLLNLDKLFQGKQIYKWLCRSVSSFEEMTDLPKSVRQRLCAERSSVFSTEVTGFQKDDDGSVKLAIRLEDGCIVETVLLTDSEGQFTACLSSQVGCAMGCRFCRTGTLGLSRNLKSSEIIEQFAHLQQKAPKKISHVVFMGMGEPMANLPSVTEAIRFLHDPDGTGLSYRRITVSTCGVATGIKALAESNLPVKLAVSLVAATDTKRSQLMPVNRTFPLSVLRNALYNFQKIHNRRFTFEYCMIHNWNISENDAQNLASFCRGLEVIVNLIPFNPCPELDFETPSEAEIRAFTHELEKRKVAYTIRVSRGRSILGACGQLAAKL
ncbi:MAG: 23S rRNA (adenine(2503)-C(2))-methyltransferase RlmN [Sphaerochaetaceae bacterium]|nr:23S rRNA (adenine(2503)-C(2))-methyltransferase RlmN [Sphaerochaetaceae bacterium]